MMPLSTRKIHEFTSKMKMGKRKKKSEEQIIAELEEVLGKKGVRALSKIAYSNGVTHIFYIYKNETAHQRRYDDAARHGN